jgi:hypothetical protein
MSYNFNSDKVIESFTIGTSTLENEALTYVNMSYDRSTIFPLHAFKPW